MKIYPDITELSKDLLPRMLVGVGGSYKPSAYHEYNREFVAESCVYDLDLGLVTGHTKRRWTLLVNQYIDRNELEGFVKLTQEMGIRGSVGILFKRVVSKKRYHQLGNCLMGICFSDNTITLLSRTCMIGYMHYIDLALAHKIAIRIGDPKSIGFRWYIVDAQVSYLKTLQTIMLDNRYYRKLKHLATHPRQLSQASSLWQQIVRVYQRRFVALEEDYLNIGIREVAKHGPLRRMVKKWLILEDKLPGNYPRSMKVKDLVL